MKEIEIRKIFDVRDPVQYAEYRYYEDISKLIAEHQSEDEETNINIKLEDGSSFMGEYVLKEIEWNRGYYDANPFSIDATKIELIITFESKNITLKTNKKRKFIF